MRAARAAPDLSKAGIVRFDGGPQPQDIRWVATIASKRLRTCIFLKSCRVVLDRPHLKITRCFCDLLIG